MPTVKGQSSLVLSGREWRYDPTTRTTWLDEIYGGSYNAVLGGFRQNQGRNNAITARTEDGEHKLIVSIPKGSIDGAVPERYEIVSEFVEKEIWSSPAVIAEAAAFDAANTASGDRKYRKLAEDTAEENDPVSVQAATYPLFASVVRHLKNGVTGYEIEYLVMRRSRRIARGGSETASIGDGLFVYTTAQLLMPSDIEFSVPDSSTLTPSSADYFWGWRRRPSTSVIEGFFVDQTSEFILSEWSTLHYTPSSVNAAW